MNVIGRGGFGKVWKVYDKKFKKYYALKEISKVKVIDKKSISTIKYERELLTHLNHPLIINLHYAFQDFHNLYFVLDLLTGGDLRYQLGHHPRKFFSEEQTKFFVACMVESLLYIHSQNIIHRDIKPENLIFDERGYLHVTDFGIAKFASKNNLNETSGTPGYMAPEVMRGLNHTGSVDYFAVGVITYELMMGKRPYLGKTRKEIKEQMMIKQIFLDEESIPVGWSTYAADFINRLLLRKDSARMGYFNDLEVKTHPWLSSINFVDLIKKKIISPFLPRRNHDNYDKKYCQEIEEIGIDTNLRYEEYRINEKYPEIFAGFTFYNVDETQLRQYQEIYKEPYIKYNTNNKNRINNGNHSNISKNTNNYMYRKSKTINVDYDYKSKINQSPSSIKYPRSQRQNRNISPFKNSNQNPNQNLSSYRNRSNISNRTINYSNADNSTNRKTPKLYLNYNQNNSLIYTNSRSSLKNGEDIYIMASPMRRGRITINSNDNNIDNSFRKYANHSFVETNYSKGKILRRSYSSSNLHNSNYINIFNLLVNNVNNINNINNNNSMISDYNNNNTLNVNYNRNYSKLSTPISYNKINKGRIPYDRRSNSNYKNYNNYDINENNYHNHHRSFIEKPKNYSFYFIDNNENDPLFHYNYNNYNNNYNDYNNKNNNTFKYRNKNLNSIFNESVDEDNKSHTYKKDKYKDIKNNNNYNYFVKDKMPTGSIRKIIPISLKDKSIENKSNTINVDYVNSNRKNNSINYNKIQTIDYVNIPNIPNNYLYIDKYDKEQENKSFVQENKKINLDKTKTEYKANNYKMNKNYSMNNINNNHNLNLEKSINKRNSPNSKSSNNHSKMNINSMNNINNSNRKKNTKIINININKPNNEKNKKNKNLSYKKIPIPLPINKTSKKKKVEIIENNNSNSKISISKINIIHNNIINNNLINNIAPINYNNDKFSCNQNSNIIKENIKNNNLFNKYKNKNINNKNDCNIINIKNNTINNNTVNNNINNQLKIPIKENIKNDKLNPYKIGEEINNNIIINNSNVGNIKDNQIKIPYTNKEIDINNLNNTNILNKRSNDIISMKINEKMFCQIKYLQNFDKYKKIKNINDRNKNKYINNENINKNNNMEKKKK